MGQKVSPISLREFINKVTDSRWIAGKKDYASLLAEDVKIRKFIEKKLKQKWLGSFSLGLSMIIGMAVAVLLGWLLWKIKKWILMIETIYMVEFS